MTLLLQGSLGNLISLSTYYVRPMPSSLSFEAAATMPYVSMVVWELLVNNGGVVPEKSEGKRIFIWGGLRGTEKLAIQLTKK